MEFEVGQYINFDFSNDKQGYLIVKKYYMFSKNRFCYDLKPLNFRTFNDFGIFYDVDLEGLSKNIIGRDTTDLYLLKGE